MTFRGFRAALLILAAGLLGWRAIAYDLSQVAPPAGKVAGLFDKEPTISLGRARSEFDVRPGKLLPATYAGAADVARRAPLEAEPFLFFGVQAATERDPARAIPLLEAARRRDPRLLPARLYLADQYLRARRVDDAIGEMLVLDRLAPPTEPILAKGLLQLIAIPAAHDEAIASVRRQPPLLNALLAEMVAANMDPSSILRVAGPIRRAVGVTPPAWQAALVKSLLDRGDLGEAANLWARFAGVDTRKRALVYDGKFNGLPGDPPFNWTLVANEAGAAERLSNGGLSIDYYGRLAGEFASQLLLLQPGSHVLTFITNGAADGRQSHLAWQIFCSKSRVPLLDVPLVGITERLRRVNARFNVPSSGCDGQSLILVGVAGESAETQSVRIRELNVIREGRVG